MSKPSANYDFKETKIAFTNFIISNTTKKYEGVLKIVLTTFGLTEWSFAQHYSCYPGCYNGFELGISVKIFTQVQLIYTIKKLKMKLFTKLKNYKKAYK